MKRRCLTLILTFFMMLSLWSAGSVTVHAAASGTCADHLTWTLEPLCLPGEWIK